jgi:hypothetical protein
VHADAVGLVDAGNVGHLVADARGDEHGPGFHHLATIERDEETFLGAGDAGDERLARLDAIAAQFLARQPEKGGGRNAIPCQVAIQGA